MRRLILSSVLAAAALIGPAPAASAAPVAPPVAAPTAPAAARGFIPIGTVVIIGQHGYLWNGFHWVMIW